MMVVMSPMGDHAPPLLAAITMTQAKVQRSFWSASMRRSIMTMMMVVVMLSRMLERKNATNASTHIRPRLLEACIRCMIILNPP